MAMYILHKKGRGPERDPVVARAQQTSRRKAHKNHGRHDVAIRDEIPALAADSMLTPQSETEGLSLLPRPKVSFPLVHASGRRQKASRAQLDRRAPALPQVRWPGQHLLDKPGSEIPSRSLRACREPQRLQQTQGSVTTHSYRASPRHVPTSLSSTDGGIAFQPLWRLRANGGTEVESMEIARGDSLPPNLPTSGRASLGVSSLAKNHTQNQVEFMNLEQHPRMETSCPSTDASFCLLKTNSLKDEDCPLTPIGQSTFIDIMGGRRGERESQDNTALRAKEIDSPIPASPRGIDKVNIHIGSRTKAARVGGHGKVCDSGSLPRPYDRTGPNGIGESEGTKKHIHGKRTQIVHHRHRGAADDHSGRKGGDESEVGINADTSEWDELEGDTDWDIDLDCDEPHAVKHSSNRADHPVETNNKRADKEENHVFQQAHRGGAVHTQPMPLKQHAVHEHHRLRILAKLVANCSHESRTPHKAPKITIETPRSDTEKLWRQAKARFLTCCATSRHETHDAVASLTTLAQEPDSCPAVSSAPEACTPLLVSDETELPSINVSSNEEGVPCDSDTRDGAPALHPAPQLRFVHRQVRVSVRPRVKLSKPNVQPSMQSNQNLVLQSDLSGCGTHRTSLRPTSGGSSVKNLTDQVNDDVSNQRQPAFARSSLSHLSHKKKPLRRVPKVLPKKPIQRMRKPRAPPKLREVLTELDPEGASAMDFVERMCILPSTKRQRYRRVFDTLDPKGTGQVGPRAICRGLKTVTAGKITNQETDYVAEVLDLLKSTGGTNLIDFEQFAVAAALSEHMASLDPSVKAGYSYDLLASKKRLVTRLFFVDATDDCTLALDDLSSLLDAGRVNEEQKAAIFDKLSADKDCITFVEYLAYLPLFLDIHNDIMEHTFAETRRILES